MQPILSEDDKLLLKVDDGCDFYLNQIIRYKVWDFHEAINFLLGVAKLNWCEAEFRENVVITISGKILTESEYPSLFVYLQFETDRLHEIWNHSGNDNNKTPQFFVDWAKSIGLDIPWGPYYESSILPSLKKSEDIHARERVSFLNLINALKHIIIERKFKRADFEFNKNDGTTTCLKNQAALTKILLTDYKGYEGISKSKISELFAEGNDLWG